MKMATIAAAVCLLVPAAAIIHALVERWRRR
jgi:peptidoglycan/LPS O-acetylase OafA/YrhL